MGAMEQLIPGLGGKQVHDQFGLARMGALYLAFPINSIREVVPYPETLTAMAATMPEVLGSIDLRGAIVPVLDLAALLGTGAQDQDRPGIIIVLRVEGKVIGVGVDEICGVVTLAPENRTELTIQSGGALATSGILNAGFSRDGRSGIVLRTDAFANLPGIPLAEDRMVAAISRNVRGAPSLLVTVGDFHLGLPASIIEATVPLRPIKSSPVDDGLWVARVDYNGAVIPVVDTLCLLGLGRLPEAREMASVLVRTGEGRRVALRIDSVLDMLRIAPEQTAAMQGCHFGNGNLIGGMLPTAKPVLLLDGDALQTCDDLLRLSRLEEKSGTSSVQSRLVTAQVEAAKTIGKPYLIFNMGEGQYAVPLEQVTEILNYSQCALVNLQGSYGLCEAILSHRGLAIPIFNLAGLLGAYSPEQPHFLLLVTDGERTSGFALQGLSAVERMVERAVGRAGGGDRGLGAVVMTSDGKTCSVLDLAGLPAVANFGK